MSENNLYDVVIIGSGPAGSFLAYQLASSGIDTIILEKEKFPRLKTCAGGLPAKVLRLIPFDLEPVIEERIYKLSLIYKLRKVFTKAYDEPLIYTVNRPGFDAYLAEKAIEAGAEFSDGNKALDIGIINNINMVKTEAGDFKARIIVGADGVNSTLAKTLNSKSYTLINLGMVCELPISMFDETLSHKNEGITMDLGTLPKGYGWIFPKRDIISIGVKCSKENGGSLEGYFYDFLRYNHLENNFAKFSTYPIPSRIGKERIQRDNFVLIGDAAGLTDPWTGEGIFYAFKSAMFAAYTIHKYLDGEFKDLRTYEELVDEEILPELKASYSLCKIFDRFPRLFYALVENSEYLGDLICRLIRGERSFFEVSERLKLGYILKKLSHLLFCRNLTN